MQVCSPVSPVRLPTTKERWTSNDDRVEQRCDALAGREHAFRVGDFQFFRGNVFGNALALVAQSFDEFLPAVDILESRFNN